jgi:IS30 family transposase
MSYHELSIEERVTVQIGQFQGLSQRHIARLLDRSPSTVSLELRRNTSLQGAYVAHQTLGQMRHTRKVCRPRNKLLEGGELFELVVHLLREYFSPEQIAGKLRSMNIPSFEDSYVCRETIYNAVYALSVGGLRKELIACFRQGKSTRKPRVGGVDRRSQIPEMSSIHVRPPEVEDRIMPGHWEGDLIKGQAIYLCDPHSPWQRGSNENIN